MEYAIRLYIATAWAIINRYWPYILGFAVVLTTGVVIGWTIHHG